MKLERTAGQRVTAPLEFSHLSFILLLSSGLSPLLSFSFFFLDWFMLPVALLSILRLSWVHLFPGAPCASWRLPFLLGDAFSENSPPAGSFGSFAQICPLCCVTHTLHSTAYSQGARNEIKDKLQGGGELNKNVKARQKYKSWHIVFEMQSCITQDRGANTFLKRKGMKVRSWNNQAACLPSS